MLKSFLFEKTNSIFQWGLQWKLQFNSFSLIHSEGSLNFRTWNARWNNKLHWLNPAKSIICWQLLHCLCDEIFFEPKISGVLWLIRHQHATFQQQKLMLSGKVVTIISTEFQSCFEEKFFEIVKKFAHGNF